ncbi:MAG TPA: hypothetical protein VMX17_06835 [Candidatus Glassbacteria bacterium]|nr:hypothetical protein [Candidatus Glassbacteria bacterium]
MGGANSLTGLGLYYMEDPTGLDHTVPFVLPMFPEKSFNNKYQVLVPVFLKNFQYKVVAECLDIKDAQDIAKKYEINNERWFNKTIFLGAGDFSLSEIKRLKTRIDNGFDILCGLQQGPMSTDEVNSKEEIMKAQSLEKLKSVVLDVVAAFGFDDTIVTLKEKTNER